MGQASDVQVIESHLPPWDRARVLCDTYLEQVGWMVHTVTRAQLLDEMLPVVYRKRSASTCCPEPSLPNMLMGGEEDHSGPHDLALVFIILAIGSLLQPESPEVLGEHFYQLSRAAVSLQPVLEKPSVVTIQVLQLTSVYNAMGGTDSRSDTSMEVTWSLTTLAAHLSQTVCDVRSHCFQFGADDLDRLGYVCHSIKRLNVTQGWPQTGIVRNGVSRRRPYGDVGSSSGIFSLQTYGR